MLPTGLISMAYLASLLITQDHLPGCHCPQWAEPSHVCYLNKQIHFHFTLRKAAWE